MSDKDGASSNNSFLSFLTTQELEDSLRFAMLSEGEADIVQIDALLAELKKRDNQKPDLTPEESLKIFKEQYSGKESEHLDCAYEPQMQAFKSDTTGKTGAKRPVIRAALLAAVIIIFVFGTMLVAQAAGLDVFGAIARWTSETFTFASPDSKATATPGYLESDAESGESNTEVGETNFITMEEALIAYGVENQILPTWIPDGFEAVEFTVNEFPETTIIYSSYEKEGSLLSIKVIISDSSNTIYEKTDDEVEIQYIDSVAYYIFENTETVVAVWYYEGVECYVSGHISKDELINMLESIK